MAATVSAVLDAGSTRASRTGARRKLRWFFPTVSGLLLAVLVFGFAPSFFLRGLIRIPVPLASLPPYLVAHGLLLTAWYALVLVQTCLVAAHRTDLHRRLGVLAAVVAVLLVPVSRLVLVRAIPRLLAQGVRSHGLRGFV